MLNSVFTPVSPTGVNANSNILNSIDYVVLCVIGYGPHHAWEHLQLLVGLKSKIVLTSIWEGTYFALGKNTQPQIVGGVDGGIF